jgi:hypothetical protein
MKILDMKSYYRTAVLLSLSLLLSLFLSACAIKSSIPDGEAIGVNQGLLVFKAISNVNNGALSYVPFEKQSNFGTVLLEGYLGPKGVFAFENGEKIFVTPVDPGEYMWSAFSIPGWKAYLHSSNRFVVRAGSITYIGDIRATVSNGKIRLTAIDREDQMKEHLRENFNKYSNRMPFEKSIAEFGL